MKFMISPVYKCAVVIITLFFLSACATKKLSREIRDDERKTDLHNSDSITTASLTPLGDKNYGWVFNGVNFDYSLTSGVDGFLRQLVSGKLDKTKIKIDDPGVFILSRDKKSFTGYVDFTYRFSSAEERRLILAVTDNPEFNCHWNYDESGSCKIRLSGLRGTIHQKDIVPTDAFKFNHAFNVSFYTERTLSSKRLLYPVAIAQDVVMSPVYVLSGVLALSLYGVLLLN